MHGRRERVRLIGVDAPETTIRRDCFGDRASAALERLAPPGSALRVVNDRERYDSYGRSLYYAWTPRGELVNAALIRGGNARAMLVRPNDRFAGLLKAAESAARRDGAGLWSACPGGE